MIKIGKAFFDDDFLWAICPTLGLEDNRYMIVLQSGCKVNIVATEEMVQAAMERIGYDPASDSPLSDLLNDDEYNELMDALEEGCTWLAKDARGVCFCYTFEPKKVGAYFEDGGPHKRMLSDFSFIAEGEKLPIQDIFRPGCHVATGGNADES